jgi:uncharacterized protein (DUF934 family)
VSVIVTDTGLVAAAAVEAVTLADLAAHRGALDLANTDDPAAVVPHFATLTLIRVAFPAFNDGRGFTLGRRLRELGYAGELRAQGHVLADQYAMARRVGFDAVEISDEMAARQPAEQWRFRAGWQAHHYQARLRA